MQTDAKLPDEKKPYWKPRTEEQRAKRQEAQRRWRRRNRERIHAYRLEWRKRNAEKERAYKQKRSEERCEETRQWKERNSDKMRVYYRAYKAKRRADPILYRAYLDWARDYYQRNVEKMRQKSRDKRARAASKTKIRRSPDEVYRDISKAVPSVLPRHIRDELIGTMCLAVLEGKLLVKNIKSEVAKYLTDYNRQNDHHRTLSLDETMRGGKAAWVDRLTEEDLPW